MTDRDDFSELISAFLDGEVTPEEKALIEERLVDNAADRRLFEEMRSIRNSLKSLPQHKLGKDLSQSVLRAAERAMLSAETTQPRGLHGRRKTVHVAPDGREAAIVATLPSSRQRSNWRVLIWVGVTIAAAVLIIFMGDWRGRERSVAVRPPVNPPGDVGGGSASPADFNRADFLEKEMADEASGSLPPPAVQGVREDKRARLGTVEEHPAGIASQRKPATDHDDVGTRVAKGQPVTAGRRGKMPESDSSLPESLERGLSETRDFGKPANGAADDLFVQTVKEDLASIEIPVDRLVVVSLDISSAAVRDHSLDNTLARNSVSFEYAAEQLAGVREAFFAGRQRGRSETDGAASSRDFPGFEGRQDQLAMAGDGGIVVFAEGPVEQVRAALKDLADQHDAFQIVGVHAGPPTSALGEISKHLAGLNKAKLAAPQAPWGPNLPSDAGSYGVADAELEGAELAGTKKMGLAQQAAVEPEPSDAPAEEAPRKAPQPTAPTPGEGVAARGTQSVPAPEISAEMQAEEPLPPATDIPPAEPSAEVPERSQPEEELAFEPAEAAADNDEADVLPDDAKPSEPDGALRKLSERSAKKNDRFKDVTDAEGDGDEKYQVKAKHESRSPARGSDMDLARREVDRQEADTDLGRRKNGEDGGLGSDASDSGGPYADDAQPLGENEKVEQRIDRTSTPAVARTSPKRAGGMGGGMVRTPPPVADAVNGQGGGAGAGPQRPITPADRPRATSAPQMVQVLFVLRTVTPPAGITTGPPGNIAADVPAGPPPAAAARVLRAEIEAAAEAAEIDVEAAEPAVPDE
jgi:hypothetical protein